MAATVRKTQVGTTVQLNTLGNSLKATPQGTSVQLGALNNTSTFYRDPANPCNGQTVKTNNMSAFRSRQLVYISAGGTGTTIALNTNGFSVYNTGIVRGLTTITGTQTATQGYIVLPSKAFYGTGGAGGAGGQGFGSTPGQPGQPGGTAINFSGTVGQIITQAGSIYGGGGGGGGGGGVDQPPGDYPPGYGQYGAGGGGGGAQFGPGGPGGSGGESSGQPGQPGFDSTGGGGGGGAYSGGSGGGRGAAGQGTYDLRSTGGAAGSSITGAQAINWQTTAHN